MNNEKNQLAQTFLAYLKKQWNIPSLTYTESLVQLQGGFETQTYRFQLNGAKEELSHPLVLRLYPEFYGSANANWESTIQNVLHGEGFPVAKAHHVCKDLSILGGAFFIMDFLPGNPMVTAPITDVPMLLGKTHADLHKIDPTKVINALREQGVQEDALYFPSRQQTFIDNIRGIPSLNEIADWLVDHQPELPQQLAVCHGDFHPLNILVQNNKITAVLDWPGLMIADPALDIANTIVLSTIPFKHIAPSLGLDVSGLDMEQFVALYLRSYQSLKALDTTNLPYYRVRRCVQALEQGKHGQQIWQHPLIVKEIIEYIQKVTGVLIKL